ncbi:MAG: LLM class flavin-dependent oxidoreductase [Acidimicrobiales bacterium]
MPSPKPVAADAPPRATVPGPLGLILPTYPQRRARPPGAEELAGICRRAECAGAGALWACDHLFWHSPSIECLSAVNVAALSTHRATVGSCVLQLPLRDTASVAKQAASISQLSGGRLVLGVGIGSHRGEYEAAGARFETRGARLDEAIGAIRHAWLGGGVGSYRQLPEQGRVPMWVGGSSEAALRRSARLGDGWIPHFVAPSDYEASLERLDKEADRAGRDPAEISRAIVVFVVIGGSAARDDGLEWMGSLYSLPARKFGNHLVSGDIDHVADSLLRYFEAGADHVAVFVAADEPMAQFEELAGRMCELRPTLR